ncbi:ABC transporter ATP-binding protein [Lacrimispora sp.]|uniref:ABC transporter ATP-binding protein n=1 Tax=Lacrimispora sp. TaxID=2719234 RepID=UPI0028AC5C72|nr:oligopeptide/dipeptide ABC transporter ATP-binding protein [Lacrimispora sp.]
MNQPLLEVRNLKKHFKTKDGILYAVDDISFTVDSGKTLGLVGESGCGKSTTGRSILRLNEPTAGEIIYKGKDIVKYSRYDMKNLRKEMQIVFQDPYTSLNPRMTVQQLIEYPLKVIGDFHAAERLERVKDTMNVIGLEQRLLDLYPHELDGGRRQRIGIARALILNPKFIVMDEPVSALDVSIQAQILNLLMELREKYGYTYLFISHNLSVVKHISDKIAVMYLGKIVEIANYETLFKNPLHPYTNALIASVPRAKLGCNANKIILKGDVPSPVNPPKGCRFCNRCIHAAEICFETEPKLQYRGDSFVACHLIGTI